MEVVGNRFDIYDMGSFRVFGRYFRSVGYAGILLLQLYGLLQEVLLFGLLELVLLDLEPTLSSWFDDAGGTVVGVVVHTHLFNSDSWFLDHNVGGSPESYSLAS